MLRVQRKKHLPKLQLRRIDRKEQSKMTEHKPCSRILTQAVQAAAGVLERSAEPVCADSRDSSQVLLKPCECVKTPTTWCLSPHCMEGSSI